MAQEFSASRPRCRLTGQLIVKEAGYALHAEDGEDFWLEMDNIPQHLVESSVAIDGWRVGRNLIWVETIGPAV